MAALAAGSLAFHAATRAAPQTGVEPDPRAAPGNLVAALGRIEPYSEIINLGAGSAPDRLDSLLVQRGDLVKKSQVLGYLSDYPEQIAQRDVLKAQLDEARLRFKTETDLDRIRIESAELHQKQVQEVEPQRIAVQEATIASLEARLANDKSIQDAQQQLFVRGTGTRRQTDDQNTLVLQGEANLNAARAHLAELNHQFTIDKVDADVQVRMARATLERMQADFSLASLERQIALADEKAQRLTVVAPIDGRILNIMIKPGEQITNGPILTMGDTSRMRAVAEVYETDISRVKVGQTAEISSRALARPISGHVALIGDMVFKNDILSVDPAARADARVVEVWIDLDDSAATQRLTNLTVDVRIDTSETGALAGAVSQ